MSSRSALSELASVFLKLGATAFGGPAVHIALLEDEVVRRRQVDDARRVPRLARGDEPDSRAEFHGDGHPYRPAPGRLARAARCGKLLHHPRVRDHVRVRVVLRALRPTAATSRRPLRRQAGRARDRGAGAVAAWPQCAEDAADDRRGGRCVCGKPARCTRAARAAGSRARRAVAASPAPAHEVATASGVASHSAAAVAARAGRARCGGCPRRGSRARCSCSS